MNTQNEYTSIIPITGGDSAGKTTSQAITRELCHSLGITPLIIPEAATHIFSAGLPPEVLSSSLELQLAIFDFQLKQETFFLEQAKRLRKKGKNVLVISDRSLLDGKAYCTGDEYSIVLDEYHMREGDLFIRYPHAIHLDSAPEKYFTYETNAFRIKRSYDEVWELNQSIKQRAYAGVPLKVITNPIGGTFDAKMHHYKAALLSIIGFPEPIEDENKYLILDGFDPTSIPVPFTVSEINQVYLHSSDPLWIERIRKRTFQDGVVLYTHTIKNRDTKIERETILHTMREVVELQQRINPKKIPVVKNRFCFLWEDQYFELDVFKQPRRKYPLLEIEKTTSNQEIILPKWLGKLEDVTDDPAYKNENLIDEI